MALTQQDEDVVLAELARSGRLAAIVEIRRRTGCSLSSAVAHLDALSPRPPMSEDAFLETEVVAVGPFSRALASAMPYGAEMYTQTRPGTWVITGFVVYSLADRVRLADALHVDLDRPGSRRVDPAKVDLAAFAELFSEEESAEFVQLRDAGFRFYFTDAWEQREAT